MSAERCPLSDIEPSACACPKHRGEPTAPPWRPVYGAVVFESHLSGRCAHCEEPFPAGRSIVRACDPEDPRGPAGWVVASHAERA